jgi:hypothetical protein
MHRLEQLLADTGALPPRLRQKLRVAVHDAHVFLRELDSMVRAEQIERIALDALHLREIRLRRTGQDLVHALRCCGDLLRARKFSASSIRSCYCLRVTTGKLSARMPGPRQVTK